MKRININEFLAVDIRIGTVLSTNVLPNARKPAYILQIDFGDHGILKTSAQLTTRYSATSLIGKQVLAVVNFPKKQIGKIQSECLVLACIGDKGTTLLTPEHHVNNGSKVF